MYNKDALLKIRRLLNGIKDCRTEFLSSRATDYAEQTDGDKVNKLLRTTQERINFVNLTTNTVDMMEVISNDEVVSIIYDFIKTKITTLDLGKFSPDDPSVQRFEKTVREIQTEITNNKNKDNIRVVKLDQLLQEIFNKLSISDLSDLDSITEALKQARDINAENDRIASLYGGYFAFVKTYQDAIADCSIDKSDTERTLVMVYDGIKDILNTDAIITQRRVNFIANVKVVVLYNYIQKRCIST